MSPKFVQATSLAVLAALAFAATDASAQTRSGGRQGTHGGGRGYNYTVTRTGDTVTGSIETNKGYGATGTHTGGVNANGAYLGTTTIDTNNGSSVTTHGAAYDGFAAGSVTATAPDGQTVSRAGAVYR